MKGYIRISKYDLLYMHTSGCQYKFPCVCLYQGPQKCCSLHASTIICKDATLNMPIFAFQKMHLFVCLCLGLYICVLIYAHIVVWRIHVSKCMYVVLSNATLCMPLSGSLRMLIYICLYMSFQWYLYLYAYISFSNEKYLSMPISASLNMLLYICQY